VQSVVLHITNWNCKIKITAKSDFFVISALFLKMRGCERHFMFIKEVLA